MLSMHAIPSDIKSLLINLSPQYMKNSSFELRCTSCTCPDALYINTASNLIDVNLTFHSNGEKLFLILIKISNAVM